MAIQTSDENAELRRVRNDAAVGLARMLAGLIEAVNAAAGTDGENIPGNLAERTRNQAATVSSLIDGYIVQFEQAL